MFISETKVRVRYSETDKMGVVYYGNYAQYYEVGRVEAMREIGASYKYIESQGFMMPMLAMNTKYIRPAKYDDLLTIRTIVDKMPDTRMLFKYEIYNEKGVLLNVGSTELVFVNKETFKPCKSPDWLGKLIKEKMES